MERTKGIRYPQDIPDVERTGDHHNYDLVNGVRRHPWVGSDDPSGNPFALMAARFSNDANFIFWAAAIGAFILFIADLAAKVWMLAKASF